jgi:hypothetical protein
MSCWRHALVEVPWQHTAVIRRSVHHALSLSNDLLTLGQLGSGSLLHDRQPLERDQVQRQKKCGVRGSQQEGPMHPIRIDRLSAEQHAELDHANRTAKDGRLRIRALIVLLAAECGMVAPRGS